MVAILTREKNNAELDAKSKEVDKEIGNSNNYDGNSNVTWSGVWKEGWVDEQFSSDDFLMLMLRRCAMLTLHDSSTAKDKTEGKVKSIQSNSLKIID